MKYIYVTSSGYVSRGLEPGGDHLELSLGPFSNLSSSIIYLSRPPFWLFRPLL